LRTQLSFNNVPNKNYCPLLSQCKATQNKIACAHCLFLQIRSLSCLMLRDQLP